MINQNNVGATLLIEAISKAVNITQSNIVTAEDHFCVGVLAPQGISKEQIDNIEGLANAMILSGAYPESTGLCVLKIINIENDNTLYTIKGMVGANAMKYIQEGEQRLREAAKKLKTKPKKVAKEARKLVEMYERKKQEVAVLKS